MGRGRALTGEPTLTWRQLNRALLARQGLLERTSSTVQAQLSAMAGLQAQYAPSMYIGLWSRVAGFGRDDLTAALERRTVVQGTLLRCTIHLVAARDWWTHAAAVRDARRAWFIRSRQGAVSEAAMEAAADTIRTRLTTDGPLKRAEVVGAIGKVRTEGIHLWLDLVRLPPSGTWERRRADLFGLAEHWLRRADPDPDPVAARRRLVRSYLKAFGPATTAEISSWAGLPIRAVEPALEGQRLRRFRTEDGLPLVDVPGAPLPDEHAAAPVRFLPTWDATLLIHARRARILDERHRPLVFSTRTPQSVPTFLVDGTVAGTWQHRGGRIETSPFEPLDNASARAVRDESDALVRLFD